MLSFFLPGDLKEKLLVLKHKKLLEASLVQGVIPSLPPNSPLLKHLTDDDSLDRNQVFFEYGQELMPYKWLMSDLEYWDLKEQTFQYGLLSKKRNIKLLQLWLTDFENKFLDSSRVQLLKGMFLEAQSQHKSALEIYNHLLEENETTPLIWKRKISCLIAMDETKEAVSTLHTFLDNWMTDTEAWEQLYMLYKQNEHYEQALFCLEELLLLRPLNPNYHMHYAKTLMSMNKEDTLQMARKHFGQVLEICPLEEAKQLLLQCHAKLENEKDKKAHEQWTKITQLLKQKSQ